MGRHTFFFLFWNCAARELFSVVGLFIAYSGEQEDLLSKWDYKPESL